MLTDARGLLMDRRRRVIEAMMAILVPIATNEDVRTASVLAARYKKEYGPRLWHEAMDILDELRRKDTSVRPEKEA